MQSEFLFLFIKQFWRRFEPSLCIKTVLNTVSGPAS